MVQVTKAQKKTVYRHLLNEGVLVLHKDFSNDAHKGTNVPTIVLRKIMRSLKDRGLVDLIFSWQFFYYFLNEEGKKHIIEYLGISDDLISLTWKYISILH